MSAAAETIEGQARAFISHSVKVIESASVRNRFSRKEIIAVNNDNIGFKTEVTYFAATNFHSVCVMHLLHFMGTWFKADELFMVTKRRSKITDWQKRLASCLLVILKLASNQRYVCFLNCTDACITRGNVAFFCKLVWASAMVGKSQKTYFLKFFYNSYTDLKSYLASFLVHLSSFSLLSLFPSALIFCFNASLTKASLLMRSCDDWELDSPH